MNTLKCFVLLLVSLSVVNVGTLSADETQKSTPIAQIDGVDVALSPDSVIASFSYGDDLKGRLLDSGIAFVLIENRTGGGNDTVTVFERDDVLTICGWDVDLSDISLVFHGIDVSCVPFVE